MVRSPAGSTSPGAEYALGDLSQPSVEETSPGVRSGRNMKPLGCTELSTALTNFLLYRHILVTVVIQGKTGGDTWMARETSVMEELLGIGCVIGPVGRSHRDMSRWWGCGFEQCGFSLPQVTPGTLPSTPVASFIGIPDTPMGSTSLDAPLTPVTDDSTQKKMLGQKATPPPSPLLSELLKKGSLLPTSPRLVWSPLLTCLKIWGNLCDWLSPERAQSFSNGIVWIDFRSESDARHQHSTFSIVQWSMLNNPGKKVVKLSVAVWCFT